jgi:hypothetical protein
MERRARKKFFKQRYLSYKGLFHRSLPLKSRNARLYPFPSDLIRQVNARRKKKQARQEGIKRLLRSFYAPPSVPPTGLKAFIWDFLAIPENEWSEEHDLSDTPFNPAAPTKEHHSCCPTKVPNAETPDKPPSSRDKTEPLMVPVNSELCVSPSGWKAVIWAFLGIPENEWSEERDDDVEPTPSYDDNEFEDPLSVSTAVHRIERVFDAFSVAGEAGPTNVEACVGESQPSAAYKASLRDSVQQLHSDTWHEPASSHGYVVWDTGASQAITSSRDDFMPGTFQPLQERVVQGLAKGSQIEGKGTVEWYIAAFDGTMRRFEITAFLVPTAKRRLISPQAYIWEEMNKSGCEERTEGTHATFSLVGHATEKRVTCNFHPSNNLPMSLVFRAPALDQAVEGLLSCVADLENENLSNAQKTLLKFHFKFGHISMEQIQKLLGTGRLATSRATRAQHRLAANCIRPRCASCQFGKQARRSTPGISGGTQKSPGALKYDDIIPGKGISVDHFICSTKGRLLDSLGKTDPAKMYKGGCIFVDHYSGAVFIKEQVGMSGLETLQSKVDFEQWLHTFGIVAQEYRTDNSTAFCNTDFRIELSKNHQVSKFAGVGAHHSNIVAERSIRTIMGMARTQMLHAAIRWPEVSDAQLWPLAVQYSVHIFNRMPTKHNGLSPIDLISRMTETVDSLQDLHPFGCPVYVLDPSLADGKKIPKWTPRSRRGVFVGVSAKHSSESPLILNLLTGKISPQYHVVFDDAFSTVSTDSDTEVDLTVSPWSDLFSDSVFQYPFDENQRVPDLGDDWTEDAWHAREQSKRTRIRQRRHESVNPPTIGDYTAPVPREPSNPGEPSLRESTPREAPTQREATPREEPTQREATPREESTPAPPPVVEIQREIEREADSQPLPARPVHRCKREKDTQTQPLRRSSRRSVPPVRFSDEVFAAEIEALEEILLSETSSDKTTSDLLEAYAAATKDPDTLRWHEMIHDEDADEFYAAAKKEINSLKEAKTWTIVPISEARGTILPGTWTFRRKRKADGTIKSYKGRFCVRGDLQKEAGDTFAPVVQWSTTRLLLYFTLFFGWDTRCVDFSNAFIQAKLDKPVFIKPPQGFEEVMEGRPDSCLRLDRSLYGLKAAPRLWFEHLKAALERAGLQQSQLDPCLFYGDKIMMVCHVDDLCIASPSSARIDELISTLRGFGMKLTDEGPLAEYLGINCKINKEDKSIEMLQTGLIDKVIDAIENPTGQRREGLTAKKTPAHVAPLHKSEDSPPLDADYDYRAVVGMLLYLSGNSRPDIAFAVSQVARFTHNPKVPHGDAVKRIVRYLKGTRTRGMILRPTGDLCIDNYVDSDFAGLFGHEDSNDPISVKSRSGYIITIGGCPLVWKSKLQSTIALSTVEAEYSALSTSMRDLLPLKLQVKEMTDKLGLQKAYKIKTKSTVFEDSTGCIALANCTTMTPRAKHIATTYHWFRNHVMRGETEIIKIDTTEQLSDIMTKSLPVHQFCYLRDKMMNWESHAS